jgi:hypothetical protein
MTPDVRGSKPKEETIKVQIKEAHDYKYAHYLEHNRYSRSF